MLFLLVPRTETLYAVLSANVTDISTTIPKSKLKTCIKYYCNFAKIKACYTFKSKEPK